MENKTVQKAIIIISGLLIALLGFYTYRQSTIASRALQEAGKNYENAADAYQIVERSQNLNEALKGYILLEKQYNPIHGNGRLYNNMAEIFDQLEQYPWAIYYLYQAKALRPRDQKIQQNLQNVLAKLNISSEEKDSIFRKVFFFHDYLSLPERLQILTLCTLLLFFLASIYIWKQYRFLKGWILGIFLLWLLFFSSVMITKYFEPLEGVIVQASMLYRAPTSESLFVDSKPIMEGNRVEVLNASHAGKWLKIRTREGNFGFIPSDAVRLLKM